MMMTHRNLLLQWKRHFDWLQRIEIHIKIQQFHKQISVFSVKVSFGGTPQHRQQSPTRVNKKQYVHCCDITVTRDDVKAFMAQRDEYPKANGFKDITVKVFI